MRKIYLTIVSATLFLHLQATEVLVSLPDMVVAHPPGTIIEIPVSISSLTGLNVEAYQFVLNFDNTVIAPEPPYFITSGTVSAAPGWSVMANSNIPNKLIIGAFGYGALSGSGSLLKLKFRVLVAEGSCHLTFSSFLFNAGNPAAIISEGSFINQLVIHQVAVSLPQISLSAPPGTLVEIPIHVSNPTGLNINGYGFELSFDPMVIVPCLPFYSINGTLCEIPGWTISANSGFEGKLTIGALGETALTGSGILIKLIFSVVLAEGMSPLNFDHFIFNDGLPGATLEPGSFENYYIAPPLTVSLPGIKDSKPSGSIVEIPVYVEDVSGFGIISYEFTIAYNESILIPEPPYFSVSGTLSQMSDWLILGNETGENELTIGAFGATALEGSGTLILLTFRVIAPEGFSPLIFQSFLFNDGNPQTATVNGSFHNEPVALIPDSLVVENRIIGNGEQVCYEANKTITVSNFTVEAAGSALFFAGERVLLLAGTRVLSNGYLHASITSERIFLQPGSGNYHLAEQYPKNEVIENLHNTHNHFRFYPNPTSGLITLKFNEDEDIAIVQVEIYSIYGERILQEEFIGNSKFDLDLSGRPSGIYLLRIFYAGRIQAEKVVVR